jgi:hypothetical protein
MPEVIECDGELMKSHVFTNFIDSLGVSAEPSAPYTQNQNGAAERSGGVVEAKSNAMRAGAKLPAYLMREIVRSAVYLHNRIPRWLHNWKTPYERFFTFLACRDGVVFESMKPKLAHLKVYGCKAYVMSAETHKKLGRKQQFNPRAWIGYLVGYNSTNIYRIWNPATNKIVVARDVIFDEKSTFSGDIQQLKDDLLYITPKELEALITRSISLSLTRATILKLVLEMILVKMKIYLLWQRMDRLLQVWLAMISAINHWKWKTGFARLITSAIPLTLT